MGTIELLEAVIATLNTVEVHGRQNLDRLLGSIKALDAIKNNLTADKKDEVTSKEEVKQDG